MKFILNKQIKYCTKEWFKLINLVAIALFIIMTVIFMKYKLVCSVSISGEHIGYVQNKELVGVSSGFYNKQTLVDFFKENGMINE